ncbi:MAG: ketoacyl-ACP synthase III [Phototrophicales bacterium]|nr:MAG: ketoacyl-ACP synthase III [Phototrophicales bacterium]
MTENGSNQHQSHWRIPFLSKKQSKNGNSNGANPPIRLPNLPTLPILGFNGRNHAPRYAHIIGWGMEVPSRVLTNRDLEAIVETNDEWIRTRTGIQERRIADERETTAQLALKAARKALSVASILPTDIDLIIVATSTPEHIFPSTASQIQDWLGANKAGAFDLSAACSGFVYALDMAAAKIRAGDIRYALVIGAETMSRVLDWTDRGTCILFGDGAGAVVLAAKEEMGGVLSSTLRSDGSGWDLLGLPTLGSRDTYLMDYKYRDKSDDEQPRLMHHLHMNGRAVFRFATRVITDSIREAVKMAGLEIEQVDLIVPHQANQRIIETAAKSLKMPLEKWYSNVHKYGNTSAASIPIALCEAIEEGRIQEGQNIVFVGFGGGLTWATMVLRWETSLEQQPHKIMDVRQQAVYWYAIQRRAIVRRWRRIFNRLAGSPTPNATMRQLRNKLREQETTKQTSEEKMESWE